MPKATLLALILEWRHGALGSVGQAMLAAAQKA